MCIHRDGQGINDKRETTFFKLRTTHFKTMTVK